MKSVIPAIKAHLSVKEIEAYTENGCNIKPSSGKKLYRIDYWKAVELAHPRANDFGSMSCFDGSDAAKELMKELFPNALVQLNIPCLVFEA